MIKPQTILIVDDTETNIDILVELLANYDLAVATEGFSALEIAKNESIDLVLLDIMMPEMDGYEVCRRLKADPATSHIPVIFITAVVDEESIEKAYELGGVDYVTKPFKPKELLARVARELKLQKQSQILLKESRVTAMSEMIKIIAHQWRQPLSVIGLSLQNLMFDIAMESANTNEMIEAIETTLVNVKTLSDTINEFVKFHSFDQTPSWFDLNSVIEDAIAYVNMMINKENLPIQYESQEHLCLLGIPSEMRQVLINLIQNGIEELEGNPDGEMTLSACVNDDICDVIIEDNGRGIDSAIIEKIFDPYFSTKTSLSGMGNGLYISKIIIENRFHGTISVESNPHRSRFIVNIPISIPYDSNRNDTLQ